MDCEAHTLAVRSLLIYTILYFFLSSNSQCFACGDQWRG